MNEETFVTHNHQKPPHGKIGSYVTGFVLSIVFTLIPYYLVVHKTLTGSLLLPMILGFAFLQLIIQVVFFLHLGRERKPRFNTVFLVATIGAVFVVIAGSVWIMGHLQSNMSPMDVTQKLSDDEGISQVEGVKTGGCQGTNANHHIIILNGIAYPNHVIAHLCDSLTFTNDDKTARNIAFGDYPHQVVYAGNIGQTLYKDKSWTLSLSQQGTYKFYDHDHPDTNGTFTVGP